MNMRTTIIMALSAVLLAGCTETEEIPTDAVGGLYVTLSDGAPSVEDLKVSFEGRTYSISDAEGVDFPGAFPVGDYTAYVYNEISNVKLVGDTLFNSTVLGDYVTPMTEALYYGSATATIENNKIANVEVDVNQMNQLLDLTINVTEGDIADLASITAEISGIAANWDCKADAASGDAVKLAFDLAYASDAYTSSAMVLGSNGEAEFTVTLNYVDGREETSDEIVTFKTDKTQTTTITANIEIVTPEVSELNGGTISGWEVMTSTQITIN